MEPIKRAHLWKLPDCDDAGYVLYRKDGKGKGQPHWPVGARVFVVTTDGRCFAEGLVSDPATWNDIEPSWEFSLDLQVVVFDGKRAGSPLTQVRRYGIEMHEGSRERITVEQANELATRCGCRLRACGGRNEQAAPRPDLRHLGHDQAAQEAAQPLPLPGPSQRGRDGGYGPRADFLADRATAERIVDDLSKLEPFVPPRHEYFYEMEGEVLVVTDIDGAVDRREPDEDGLYWFDEYLQWVPWEGER